MTKEEKDMLVELLECGGETGVWDGNFTNNEQAVLKLLSSRKYVAAMWKITKEGRKAIEDDAKPKEEGGSACS